MAHVPEEGDYQDLIDVANPTEDDFTVSWDKVPHTIAAGEGKIMQRFIAEHFCKHLTDRQILRRKTKRNLNNEGLRAEWRDKIIVGVHQSWEENKPLTEGERVARQNDALNQEYDDRIKKLEKTIHADKTTPKDVPKRAEKAAPEGKGKPTGKGAGNK